MYLISALIARGSAHRVLENCLQYHTVVVSQFILDELQEKLVERFKYTAETAIEALNLLQSRMEIVAIEPLSSHV